MVIEGFLPVLMCQGVLMQVGQVVLCNACQQGASVVRFRPGPGLFGGAFIDPKIPEPGQPFVAIGCLLAHHLGGVGVVAEMAKHGGEVPEIDCARVTAEDKGLFFKSGSRNSNSRKSITLTAALFSLVMPSYQSHSRSCRLPKTQPSRWDGAFGILLATIRQPKAQREARSIQRHHMAGCHNHSSP